MIIAIRPLQRWWKLLCLRRNRGVVVLSISISCQLITLIYPILAFSDEPYLRITSFDFKFSSKMSHCNLQQCLGDDERVAFQFSDCEYIQNSTVNKDEPLPI